MDTNTQQLKAYITSQIQLGLTPDEISQQLVAAGWPAATIQAAFQEVQAATVPTAMQAVPPVAEQPASHEPSAAVKAELAASAAAAATEPAIVQSPGAQPAVADPTQSVTTASAVEAPHASGVKRGRIKTGWLLLKQSVRVLKTNPYLLKYMFLTYAWYIVFTIIFVVAAIFSGNLLFTDGPDNTTNATPAGYVFIFVNYVAIYFIINFYAAALAANMIDLFQGKNQGLKVYTGAARKKFVPIFTFTLIEATLGMLLRAIAERLGWVGAIIEWLVGTAWSLATVFVLPIIMTSDANAPKAIGQSVLFFKNTWGESVTAKVGVNFPLAVLNILAFIAFIPVTFLLAGLAGIVGFCIAVFLFILVILTLAIVGSFANSLINVSLFYYAQYHQIPPSFDAELLNKIFIEGKPSRFSRKRKSATA